MAARAILLPFLWSWLHSTRCCLAPSAGAPEAGQGGTQALPGHRRGHGQSCLGPSCLWCPGASSALGMETVEPGSEAVVSPDSTKIAGRSLPGRLPDSISHWAIFSKVGNVCCFWDMQYPGPEGRQRNDPASRGDSEWEHSARDRSQWRSPSSAWEEQCQEETTKGTRVPMELGSMVVLV